ncbi:FecR family protein [Chitinophaga vietnamensis]|uniref:FecR family protein n=1 Tax=Chitinophaga vietnamensis TaxID=2593957 RepID=UPI0011787889|nr:FecR family protein [Chitinophaga vietnamensis]
MDTEQIKILLEKYNQGTCSAEEAEIIEQWFERINRHQSVIADNAAIDRQLADVKQQLNEYISPARPARNLRPWYYAAAAAIVLLAAGIFWFNRSSDHAAANKQVAQARINQSSRIIRNGFLEITTARGATDTITLADGSFIMINSASKLRVPQTFSGSSRDVYLDEGEAFFNAAPDPANRFTAHSGALATTALGTAFNVRAYAHEKRITVALVSGKVKIDEAGHQEQSMILMPSEQLSYDLSSLAMIKSTFHQADDVSGWRKGYIIFKDAPYSEIVTELENRFGVTVINQSNKKEWHYNGSFKDENLQDILDVISIAKSLSYTIKNDTIYLQNKN